MNTFPFHPLCCYILLSSSLTTETFWNNLCEVLPQHLLTWQFNSTCSKIILKTYIFNFSHLSPADCELWASSFSSSTSANCFLFVCQDSISLFIFYIHSLGLWLTDWMLHVGTVVERFRGVQLPCRYINKYTLRQSLPLSESRLSYFYKLMSSSPSQSKSQIAAESVVNKQQSVLKR